MTKERSNYYIIKQSKGTLWAFFYDFVDGICCMTYTYDSWSKKQIIYKNGAKNFSVYLDTNDKIYVFCQDTSGNIVLCQYSSSKWTSQILLYSKSGFLDSLHFDAIINGEDLFLFYNLKDPHTNRHALVQQIAIKGTKWNTPSLIDYIEPLENHPFSVYKTSNNNILLFYQKYQDTFQLGYKKYLETTKTWSEFSSFDHNKTKFVDKSILIINKNFQTLYIKKEKYYSTLFYRLKTASKWEEPIKLFEKSNITSCSLFTIDNHLWATWVCDGTLYSCYSTDSGNTFSPPTAYINERTLIPIKAHYQNNVLEEKKHLFTNEIYINSSENLEFLIIPDIFPAITGNTINLEENFIVPTEKVDNYLNEIKSHIKQVYEEIYLCKKELREKNNQISQLKYTLKIKKQDLSKITYDFKKMNEKLQKEITNLKNKNKNLEKELAQKNNEIKILGEKITAQRKGMNILKQELELRKAPLIITTDTKNTTSKKNKSSLLKRLFSFEEENTD
ncbi:hypothetical protein [Defluviitalea phaphyphila]|uniref:hypothetical protein n=1 Tax=Defluviitalea phaphyphila TaxID=1473580 RepID=UPI000731A2DF|nr:hypothetical protein [Defluviitalea phaphyphila]